GEGGGTDGGASQGRNENNNTNNVNVNVERQEGGAENNAALVEMIRELRLNNAESQETARQAMEKVSSMAELVAKLSNESSAPSTNVASPEQEQERQAFQSGLGELR